MPTLAFRLNQQGLARLFGTLETRVLDTVWRLGEATVQDVVQQLGRAAHYKTTMTVINRLVDKRVLERRKVSRAYVYRAPCAREVLLARLSRQVLDNLIADAGPQVMVQFVEAVSATNAQRLSELAVLVEERLTAETVYE